MAELMAETIAAAEKVLQDPDLLYLILSFSASSFTQATRPDTIHLLTRRSAGTRALVRVSHLFRQVTLRPDLPRWRVCEPATFAACEPASAVKALMGRRSTILNVSARWTCENITRALHAKTQLQILDLTACRVSSPDAAARLVLALPDTLHTLACTDGINQPDAMLHALLRGPRLPQLPNLTSLDVSGVCTERTLAGLRLLGAREADDHRGSLAAALAPALPRLEALSVGFHTFTALGVREGEQFLHSLAAKAPRLRRIGCELSAAHMPDLDVVCGVCGTTLFRGVSAYLAHPPQQPHISYEIHTDHEPERGATRPMPGDGDEPPDASRLQCARDCMPHRVSNPRLAASPTPLICCSSPLVAGQPGLWTVDAGSMHVRHVLGHRYAVACGGPRSGRPPLAVARRARTSSPNLAAAPPATEGVAAFHWRDEDALGPRFRRDAQVLNRDL